MYILYNITELLHISVKYSNYTTIIIIVDVLWLQCRFCFMVCTLVFQTSINSRVTHTHTHTAAFNPWASTEQIVSIEPNIIIMRYGGSVITLLVSYYYNNMSI